MAQSDLRRAERAARKLQAAKEEMRVAVKLARAAGETQADIARATGYSPSRIAQIERGQ